MLQPARTKYRKAHKGRIHGIPRRGESLPRREEKQQRKEKQLGKKEHLENVRVRKEEVDNFFN